MSDFRILLFPCNLAMQLTFPGTVYMSQPQLFQITHSRMKWVYPILATFLLYHILLHLKRLKKNIFALDKQDLKCRKRGLIHINAIEMFDILNEGKCFVVNQYDVIVMLGSNGLIQYKDPVLPVKEIPMWR